MISLGKVTPESRILFVNDGSQDQTWPIIKELHSTNALIDGLSLSGNVGHQSAIMAGMLAAREYSDAVVTIDADLQDDLDAVEEMLDRLAEGYDIVYGVKESRMADPFLKRTTALTFYRLQRSMGIKAIFNHADFRLLSRQALDALAQYPERNLYLRGLIPQLGFRSTTVKDVIRERTAGSSKYTLRKMLLLAVDGITSFTTRPISWIIGMGLAFLLISVCMAVYVVVSYVEHLSVPGWASLMLSLWFIGSILLLSIGVIGQYIGKIYIEIKQRPRYHIAQFLKHNDDDQ
jgi:glycosyltransferase, group 2 family